MKNFTKISLLIAFLLLAALPCFAQNTTAVTGTIVDPNGLPYAGATITAVLSNPSSGTGYTIPSGAAYTGVIQVNGGANSSGVFNMQLVQNAQLTPASSTWAFTVCQVPGITIPLGTGSQCFTVSGITITGSSQDISANLNAAALSLTQKANLSRIYNTSSAVGNASLSAATMFTPGATSNPNFRVSFRLTQIAAGTSCSTNTTIVANVIFTDPLASGATTAAVQTFTIVNNGVANTPIAPANSASDVFAAKAATAVQYSTVYVAGTGCSPAPTYQITPILELL